MKTKMHGRAVLVATWMLLSSGQGLLAGTVHRMQVCSSKGCVWASAVCVSEDPQVYLTVAHAFRLGHGEIRIDMHNGTAQGRHVLTSQGDDLAVVVVDKGGTGKAYRLTEKYPVAGQTYDLIGFPGGKPKTLQAVCTKTKFGNLAEREFNRPVSHGMSGGAASSKGVLYGIISSSDLRGISIATTGPTLLATLRHALPDAFAEAPPPAPPPPIDPPTRVIPRVPFLPHEDPAVAETPQEPSQAEDDSQVGFPIGLALKALTPLLPWTLGPIGGAAATLGAGFLWKVFRRRKRGSGSVSRPPLPNRDMDEASQLIELGRLEGRNPLLDGLRWMFAEDEIGRSEEKTLVDLQEKVNRRAEEVAPLTYTPRLGR